MLTKITTYCTMGCTHCLEDATVQGTHMSEETFIAVLDFITKHDLKFILISGGEPTDHPLYERFIGLIPPGIKVIVLSNGLFTMDERRRFLNMPINYQIINDPAYYPKRVPRIEQENVLYDDKVFGNIYPLGRAKTNGIEVTRQSPSCYNLRVLVKNKRDFIEGLLTLRTIGKMCSPSIDVEGNLLAGECRFCSKVGTVWDPNIRLTQNCIDLKCNRCGLFDNLSPAHRAQIYC